MSPTIPATLPAPFEVGDDARVAPINELARLAEAPGEFVMVGSGKTATDGIIWLLANGVSPDRIIWIRPRDPWMQNRAMVQPDPVVAINLAADTMASAIGARSADEVFLRLEEAGAMFRLDRDVVPTMARAPTLGAWELDILRTVERVVRLGHVRRVSAREIMLDRGTIPLAPRALVVHCAASGIGCPPLIPIWAPDRIRLQMIRPGFPCFCAALAGYVEATRDNDRERNRLCPPNRGSNDTTDWAQMVARGTLATRVYGAEPDIVAWMNHCTLQPARVLPSHVGDPAVKSALARLAGVADEGLSEMARIAGIPLPRLGSASR